MTGGFWICVNPVPLSDSDCLMTVRSDLDGDGVPDTVLFTLAENQTKSVTLRTLSRLEVSCSGERQGKCTGRFCLRVHYVTGPCTDQDGDEE